MEYFFCIIRMISFVLYVLFYCKDHDGTTYFSSKKEKNIIYLKS